MPGVGLLSDGEIRRAARITCDVPHPMGPEVPWIESYVTAGETCRACNAANEAPIRAHARRGGVPAGRVSRIVRVTDPTAPRARSPEVSGAAPARASGGA